MNQEQLKEKIITLLGGHSNFEIVDKELEETAARILSLFEKETSGLIKENTKLETKVYELSQEKQKWERKKIIIPKGKTHPLHDRCEECVEIGRQETISQDRKEKYAMLVRKILLTTKH